MKKKLPIGISDFKTLIENDYYFFDKTLFIDELLINRHGVTLLPRPRRFGKTLNMSMIKYFFDIRGKEENRKLFKGLEVEKTENFKYQGEFPVIFLSLKDIKENNWEECFKSLTKIIYDLYKVHEYVLEKLKGTEKNDFENILFKKDNGEYQKSLLNLSKYLYDYYGKKVIILIDEYDSPLISAHTQNYYDDAIIFFRNFFSTCLKDNPYLEIAVMTGILRIGRENIFSGLNNLKVSSILNEGYSHFGVTENEVKEALEYYEMPCRTEEVKEWYDGYKFGNQYIHNPWSIINFLDEKKLDPYWVNTSDNILIKNMIKDGDENIQKNLEKLFRNENIKVNLSENLVFEDLLKANNFWSLMFFSGYLTYSEKVQDEFDFEPSYLLKIPNLEVTSFFKRTFIDTSSAGDNIIYSTMLKELCSGNVAEFSKIFKKIFLETTSYHDQSNDEKYYHQFMTGLLIVLGNIYNVNSNRESGYGRYDICIEPKTDKNRYGIIFELKTATEETLEEKAMEALEQIDKQKYDVNMMANGVKKIIKIGMAFAGKRVEIRSKLD